MTSTPLDPIEIEGLIVARLEDRVQKAGVVRFVYDTKTYAAAEEESQLHPALAVIYNGYRVGTRAGTAQEVELEYLVVAISRSSKQTLRASGAKEIGGSTFHAVLQTLIGWKPAPGVSRLTLGEAPGAGYSDAGFQYLPIAFNTRVAYTPQPQP